MTDTGDWLEWVRAAADLEASPATRHRAFGRLVAHFQDLAFGCAYAVLCERGLAEDAAQEAFLAAWCQLPTLRDPAAFPGWLKRVVLNRCAAVRRQRPTGVVPLTEALERSSASPDRERDLVIREAVAALPEAERMALLLFHVGRYSRAEVAAFLGSPPSPSKSGSRPRGPDSRKGSSPCWKTISPGTVRRRAAPSRLAYSGSPNCSPP